MVASTCGPSDQNVVGAVSSVVSSDATLPLNINEGKNALFATPICSFAAAICRSAAAISGRRSNRLDGTPTEMTGGGACIVATEMDNSEGGLPVNTAIAC